MIKSARFQNFTTLPNDNLRFAPGLNVVIAENGLGKTHLLKALYSILKVNASGSGELTKTALQREYAEKLVRVFRADTLGRLVKRKQGRERCELAVEMRRADQSCAINFASQAVNSVQIDQLPTARPEKSPVFLPTRELLTLCPWFVPLYDNYHVEFEESWRDTCSLLGAPGLRGARSTVVAKLLGRLEEAMGGKVIVDGQTGRFYLQIPGEGKLEMPLVAEGLRKVAMLARLVSTGELLEQGCLFWDEPEANLNPKLIKVIAASIMVLCSQGVQVFMATHSLFLLRELEMLASRPDLATVAQRYFSLKASQHGVELEQGDSVEDLETLVLLDEELKQSDRFMGMEPDNG
ncbi:AAA family ATPase [Chitinimonas lacunae]|uniref:ATP/GTP-binding protein n=1 Tax=Chitinimonas lacunae TaxID=1963018 RepID=A0ABV8MNR9_9NEIS